MSEQIVVEETGEILVVTEGQSESLVVTQEQIEIISAGAMGPPGATGATGPTGATGATGSGAVDVINFAWGDSSPALMVTVAANKRVYRIRLVIETAFNGASPALTVGSVADADELMSSSENAPDSIGMYETYPDHRYVASTAVNLTITPGAGASTGAGQVHLEIEP